MRKSREFDDILDECLESLLTEGATIEQCLRRFPEHADELKPLLETALATKKVSAIQPSPAFRNRARYEFHAALEEVRHRKSRPFFGWTWQPRWATVVAVVLVLFLAGGSTVAAAAGSMPDDPLYPVKLATEQVQLAFTFSTLGKAELNAELADKRVTEIIQMAEENKPEQIERIAERLDTYLTEIAVLSSTQEVPGGLATAPAVEEAPAVKEAPVLEEAPAVEEVAASEEVPAVAEAPVLAEAPAVAEAPALEEAPTVAEVPAPEETPAVAEAPLVKEAPALKKAPAFEEATEVEETPLLTERAEGGREAGGKIDRRAKLKETVKYQSDNNTARLRASLEKVPESAKSALRQAIDRSEKGYRKALRALD